MARCIAQVALHRKGALPEDDVVNTWHFESDSAFDFTLDDLQERIELFYDTLGSYWAATLNGNGTMKFYNWDDPTPRIPQRTVEFTHGVAATAYPNEVCLCLSMEAEQVSGGVKARRRGRVFLGPLASSMGAQPTGGGPDVYLQTADRNIILDAAEAMARSSLADAYILAVYSPRTKELGGTDDAAWNDVVRLWMDDAFDIQRRRGARPRTRDERLL